MDWRALFSWIESTGLSTWIRESPSLLGFPTILTLHAIGMGFLVGVNAAMDLRILGFASAVPISSMVTLTPVMKFGFWLNAISGLALVIASPTKHLTNPVFHVKLILIALALVIFWFIRKTVIRVSSTAGFIVPGKGKFLAGTSMLVWAGAIVAGRLLYYTFTRVDFQGIPY